ncbi:MAG: radical SAM protein [Treponema sp.]|uniref:radical SAM protein n=1 Tax=Treponema sp. TaxID=166 RepID=UPI00298DC4AD|nr:radical SAM protein [Treponema sp.]MBR5933310.1 radical SAM protein [Treponema sp.]
MKVVTIIPPIIQLNSPYPSGAYLTSFFKGEGFDACQADFSIELFYAIFSHDGIKRLFELSEQNALALADKAEKKGDDNTAFNLRRYVSTKSSWIEWIDFITSVLTGGGAREKEHQFLYSPFAPRGQRMENYLASLADAGRDPSVDDVRFLCSYALEDLSDYITAVFDPEFSLIRYAESLTVDERSFFELEKGLDSPVLKEFYEPLLSRLVPDLVGMPRVECVNSDAGINTDDGPRVEGSKDSECGVKTMICISIPFAGTFISALYTARYLKKHYGKNVFICIGGGFVNTELRDADDVALAKYIDAISYDRGYGSYRELFKSAPDLDRDVLFNAGSLYKMRLFFSRCDGNVIIHDPIWNSAELEKYESEITPQIIPDYSDIDFSKYLRVCDDKNAMHRLWTDGSWIKAYLAHGCYWHRCAFCDTKLDYVCGYRPVDTEKLYDGLLKTAREKNIFGIHFVDEAMPPAVLKQFALKNARENNPLYFWGNIRFEKSFTKDLAAFLSYCGLGGVSAGLEVATGSGLKYINKGTDINSIINACAAFKETGILVHAYMIYGFWYDTAQSIIDSMETLRQFFASSLLDSSFWHKFVLTRNSTVYREWQEGRQNDLFPVEQNLSDAHSRRGSSAKSIFATNNLHFKNEASYDKFGPPLEAALDSWMQGDENAIQRKVQKWFDFKVPEPTVPRDFVEKQIARYEQDNANRASLITAENVDNLFWLGGNPVKAGNEYRWLYLLEEEAFPAGSALERLVKSGILASLSPQTPEDERKKAVESVRKDEASLKALKSLHGRGLVIV